MKSLSYILAVLPALCNAAPQPRAANPSATIASGVVIGTATKVLNQPKVTGLANAYLGVPYAKSPPARFGPPEPAKAWSKPFVAQTQPPACLQQFLSGEMGAREKKYFNNPGLPAPVESEDCMYLNVFAPQSASPTNLKPVLFWIFGGNLQIGSADLAYYNGSSLAVNHDIVVVAINYRTNMFGFSGSPEIPYGKRNSGFLDQRFALQWVQKNIKAFGGDPTKVTIFGESAGGYSVKQLLANPPSPLPYRAAILESQQAATTGNASLSYQEVAAHFNCTRGEVASPLACLRKVSGTDIQSYIVDNNLSFPPQVGDGTDSGTRTDVDLASGKFAAVPVLLGTNSNEFSVFLNILCADPDVSCLTDYAASLGLPAAAVTSAIQSSYVGNITNNAGDLASKAGTDLLFTCTTQTFSSAIQMQGRQPVWRYQYQASFPNLNSFDSPTPGAYHSSEIPSVFGTYPLNNQYGKVTPVEIALSQSIQTIWSNFAKNPSAGPGWPKLGSNNGVELGVLGGSAKPAGERTANLQEADSACTAFSPILIAAGQAY